MMPDPADIANWHQNKLDPYGPWVPDLANVHMIPDPSVLMLDPSYKILDPSYTIQDPTAPLIQDPAAPMIPDPSYPLIPDTSAPLVPGTIQGDDPATVGNAYGSYVTTETNTGNRANDNQVNLYPKEPDAGDSAGAMVSGDVIGAYIDTNSATSLEIKIDAQDNEVNFIGARAGADEAEWRAHGGYGAVISGTAPDVTIEGGVKNNKVIYGIDKDIVQLGGGLIVANGEVITIGSSDPDSTAGSAEGNSVDLNSGDGKDVGINIFGGLISSNSTGAGAVSILESANAINNVVNLTGGTTIQTVIAGGIRVEKNGLSGKTEISGSAINNTVNISGGSKILGSINAGLITASYLTEGLDITGGVSGNTVYIEGGDLDAQIYAGRIVATVLDGTNGDTYTISGGITDNIVELKNMDGKTFFLGGSLEVYGISGAGTFDITGNVSGNKIIGGGGRAGNIFVSYIEESGQKLNITSSANSNILNVSSVEGNPSYMSTLAGGYVEIVAGTPLGTATSKTITSGAHDNIVNIKDVSITKAAIFGGYVTGSTGGTVKDNIVNISGNDTKFEDVVLYGGYNRDNPTGVSGNILNLGTSGLTAYGIGAFNTINFDLSKAVAGDVIFTVTDGNGQGHPIFKDGAFTPDNGAIDLKDVNIDFLPNGGPDINKIKLSDRIHLIAETSGDNYGFTNFTSQDILQTTSDAKYYYKTIVNNTLTSGATSYLDLFHNKIEATGNWSENTEVIAGENAGEDVELDVSNGRISSAELSATSHPDTIVPANSVWATITAQGLDITANSMKIALDSTDKNKIKFGDITIGGGHNLTITVANTQGIAPADLGYTLGNNIDVYGAGNTFDIGSSFDATGKKITFYVEEYTPANATMLEVSGTVKITNSDILLTSAGYSTLLQVGDRINLLKATVPDTDFTDDYHEAKGTGVFGTTSAALTFDVSNNDTLYALINEVTADKKAKSVSEGVAASLAFLGQSGELAAQEGIVSAVSAAEDKKEGYSAFTAGSLGKSKYETGSYVEVSGVSFLAGLAKEFNNYTLGAFLEYGSGSYDTNNSFSGAAVKGDGSASYTGGGVLGKFINEDGYYFDFSGRLGQVKTNFNSVDYVINGISAKYDYDALYYGLHLGAGHIFYMLDGVELDLYGRYLFTRQNGKEVSLAWNENINFEASNSHRFKLGGRAALSNKAAFSPYAGLALEYECGGEVNAVNGQGLDIDVPSLKGASGVGELGLRINGARLQTDLSAQGYAGKRQGFAGSFKLGYKF
jgi:hypothetical protein